MLHVLLLASTALTTRLGPARLRGHRCSAPQAKVGHRFTSLPTADDYTQLLKGASDEDINVVKFTAPWCNTCRASAAKLDYVAKSWPRARFYSIDLGREGAEGEKRVLFQSLNVTKMPYVEVYLGPERVDTLVVPPSRVGFLHNSLREAQARLRQRRVQLARRRVVLSLRANLRAEARARTELARERRRWRLLRVLEGSERFRERVLALYGEEADEQRQAERRRHLLVVRSLARRLGALSEDRARLERRRRLLRKVVARVRRLALA